LALIFVPASAYIFSKMTVISFCYLCTASIRKKLISFIIARLQALVISSSLTAAYLPASQTVYDNLIEVIPMCCRL